MHIIYVQAGTYNMIPLEILVCLMCVCVCTHISLAVSDTSLSSGEYDLFPSPTQ